MSNSGRLAVNFGGLDGISGEISAAVSALRGRLDRLESELAPLKADWTGEASAAYQSAKTKWDQAINDLNATLAQTGTAVSDSAADYRRAENANRASFGG